MKRAIIFGLLLATTGAYAQADMVTDTTITPASRSKAVAELQRTKAAILKSINGLSAQQLSYKADSSKWSINEVMEHIALAEAGIFSIVQGTLAAPVNPAKRAEIKVTDEDIQKRLTNRSFKAQSPEIIKPTGKFKDAIASSLAFEKMRNTTIDFIANTGLDLKDRYWQHPATGTIDLYQTILLISAHSERHYLQIAEVKADVHFPVK